MAGTAAFRRLHQLADRAEPSLRNAYLDAIKAVQNATSAIRLAAAIQRGDIRVVDQILNDARIERDLRRAADAIRRLTLEAARLERVSLGLSGAFTQVNPRAVRAAEQQAARFVTRVSAETKKAIRAIVAQSVGGELTPLEAAERIRPLIGLTSQQARAVVNLRRQLIARGAKDIDAKLARYSAKLLRLRARTIARTETIAAANRGQQAVWEAAQADGLLPPDVKRRWITTPDDRLCPQCQSVGGQVVRLDQPFFTPLGLVMTPPLHPNCLPGDALVSASGRIAAVSKRPFDGDVVVINTASGKRLSATPNHPILTPRGWIPASALDVASDVISQRLRRGVFADDDREHVPTRFHEIAEAFRCSGEMSAAEVPVAAEDFHGDGFGGEVAVIRTDRTLMRHDDAAILQQPPEGAFEWADVELLGFDRLRMGDLAFDAFASAADCGMCGGDLGASLVGGHEPPFDALGFALGSGSDAAFNEASPDSASIHAERLGESEFRGAGEVFADQIVRIDLFSCSHLPVFNMETARGWYVANGIVTHNCRCAVALDVSSLALARGARQSAAA